MMMLFLSCSVEKLEDVDSAITEANLVYEVDDCKIYNFDFGTQGEIEVRNFYDYIEVNVVATNQQPVSWLSLHFTENLNDFPTRGNGDLNIYTMYYSEKQNTYGVNLTFSFEELGIQTSDDLLIAAVAQFGTGKKAEEISAGDLTSTNGKWSYFNYEVTPFTNYAGTDQLREMTLSEVTALPSWDEVRKVYANMLNPGVNKTDGVYNPSIWDLINNFNDPNRESQIDDYTTTYTLGEGDCADSVNLTLRVIPD